MKSKMNLAMILRMCGAFAVLISITLSANASAVRPSPVSLSANGELLGGFVDITVMGSQRIYLGSTLSDSTPDGEWVTFTSSLRADSFVPTVDVGSQDPSNPFFLLTLSNVFARNMRTSEIICVSCQMLNGVYRPFGGVGGSISANGRYVVYVGANFNVPNTPTNQVFRVDLQTGAVDVVSIGTNNLNGNADSRAAVISDDGRYVAFISQATNLVSGYPNVTTSQMFVRDMQTNQTFLASHAAGSNNTPGNSDIDVTQGFSISGNGRFTVWTSAASNYSPFVTDTNNVNDVFFYDIQGSPASNIGVASISSTSLTTGNAVSGNVRIAKDSSSFPPTIIFTSNATNINPVDTNPNTDVYCYKGETVVRLVSIARDGAAANAASDNFATISRDGRYVAFSSKASNLVTGTNEATNTTSDVFLRDLQTNTTRYVSLNSAGLPSSTANGATTPALSDDGRFVAFTTTEPLSIRDNMGTSDIYVRDMKAGVSVLATLNKFLDGGENGGIGNYALTRDGRTIFFTVSGINLWQGDLTTIQNPKVFQSNISLLSQKSLSDFNGDVKNDYAVFRPSEGIWYGLYDAVNGGYNSILFGENGNRITPGDYDGDGKTDYAVFIPAFGRWDILQSSDNAFVTKFFGTATDILAPADFDGDGKTDLAYFRPSNATWYILQSNNNSLRSIRFGLSSDVPTIGDYDGDNRADIAIFRPSSGDWWILQSSNNSVYSFHWGITTDKPVAGDYDGDGKTDAAVFRGGIWYILNSRDNSFLAFQWGLSDDRVVPSDYDGDGRTDIAVFRPSNSVWYIYQSSTNSFISVQWGASGDVLVPSAYLP